MARRGSNVVYSTIPKYWECLIVNNAINVVGGVLHGFYMFRGERLRDDYIKFYKLSTCMAMQKKNMDDYLPIKESLSFLKGQFQVGC